MIDIMQIAFALLLVAAPPIAALLRLQQICAKLVRGTLVARRDQYGLPLAKGYIGIVILFAAALGLLAVAYGTFFLMKSGSASGVPLGMAMFALPVVWIVSELLISRGFAPKSATGEAAS